MMIKKSEIANRVRKKTDFYKGAIETMLDAFSDVIIEALSEADLDENVEIQVAKGIVVGGRRVPEHPAKDPRNQADIMVPERVLPYVRFSETFKEKINEV